MKVTYDGSRAWIEDIEDIEGLLRKLRRDLEVWPVPGIDIEGMGISSYCDKYFLYKRDLGDSSIITIPTGSLSVTKLGTSSYIKHPVLNQELVIEGISKLDERLRYYQVEAVLKAIEEKRGIIKAATGSGKSFILSELCQVLPGDLLVTVPTKTLLYQMKGDMVTYGIDENDIGLVGDSNRQWGRRITLAIPDTLSSVIHSAKAKDKEVLYKLAQVNAWIADEVHCNVCISSMRISNHIRATNYRIGLSATPWSNQGLGKVLIGMFGRLIYNMSEGKGIEEGYILKPKVHLFTTPKAACTPALLSKPYSHVTYNILYKQLILNNKGRNQLIADITSDCLDIGDGAVILIVSKINTNPNHPDKLLPLIRARGHEIPLCHGRTKTKDMKEVLEGLKDGSLRGAMFGPGVMKEGVNIPSIKYLILAGAGSSDISLLQRVGRALRTKEGKGRPYIFDFNDEQSFFRGQASKRQLTYIEKYGNDCVRLCSYSKEILNG